MTFPLNTYTNSIANELPENSHEQVIKRVLEYKREFDQEDILKPQYKKLVFVVGNSGTGKSTLISYLAGDNLVVRKINGKLTVDNNTQDDIEIGHGLESKTFFPRFKDICGTVYCDMPGFGDTRGIIEEISKAIFMKEVADYVTEVKILVTIAYSDIDARGHELRSLVTNLSRFIPDINSFHDGIDVVITKVESNVKTKQGRPVFDADEDIIQEICDTLNNFIKNNFNKFLFFKSIIDQKRLKIFRKPLEEGTLRDLELDGLGKVFENEQKDILNSMNNTSYLSKATVSFGYSVTSDAQLDSIGIAKALKVKMANDMAAIFAEIQKYYSSKINTATDIYDLKRMFDTQDWGKDKFVFSNPISFLQDLEKKLNEFKIGINQVNFKNFVNKNKFLDFLRSLSVQIDKYENYKALDFFLDFWANEKSFNQVLLDLVNIKLSEQTLIDNLNKLKKDRNNERLISDIVKGFGSFTEEQKSEIKKLLDCILKSPEVKDNGDLKIVVGHIVKLSEVLELISKENKSKNIKSLCIYSSKAIIMDNKSLELRSKNVSIISPEWYMFGMNKITLDGEDGKPHDSSKAADVNGCNLDGYGKNGDDGLPGKSGHSAGNFLGVGSEFFNPSGLTISANGGTGGNGQDGGNGSKGKDGSDAEAYKDFEATKTDSLGREIDVKKYEPNGIQDGNERVLSSKIKKQDYKRAGTSGMKGGSGGKGGKGGLGGESGIVEISSIKIKEPQIKIFVCNGSDGKNGKSGDNGQGGKHGKDAYTTFFKETQRAAASGALFATTVVNYGLQNSRMSDDKGKANDGDVPKTLNSKDIENPQKIEMTWYEPFIQYKKYMAENIANKFLKHNTEEFLKALNEIQGNLGNS